MSAYQVAPSPDAPKRLGRYELVGQLATGGMAEIHLARLAGEGGFEKIVVVKRLLPELVASPAYVAMFLDEGKLVSRLDHPNICEVHELGRDGAEYYLAMPYLDGIAVHELIARPRDPDRIAQLRVATGVIVGACAGLHHAHELRDADGGPAGLVHRDVSPSNLFVTAAGVVKVLDFGIAKVRGAAETEVGTIKGKQQYMAPEQLLGEPLDRRCDVFALGIVLFELATHQRLFKRASDYLTARAVLEEAIPRADASDPAVPAALADVIAKALARDPGARYATAAALATAVEAAMAAHGGIAGPSMIAAAVTSTDELSQVRTRQARVLGEARSRAGATDTQIEAAVTRALRHPAAPLTELTETTRTPRMRSRFLVLAGIGAVLAVGIVAIVALRGDEDAASARAAVGSDDGDRSRAATRPGANTGDGRTLDHAEIDEPRDDRAGALTGGRSDRSDGRPDGEAEPPADGRADASTGGPGDRPDDRAKHRADGSTGGPGDRAEHRADAPPDVRAVPIGDPAADRIEMPADSMRQRKPGRFSIDSKPYATIFIGNQRLGVTPIVKRTLPAGRHKLRAVLEDGRRKELTIDIPAGRLARPIQLTW